MGTPRNRIPTGHHSHPRPRKLGQDKESDIGQTTTEVLKCPGDNNALAFRAAISKSGDGTTNKLGIMLSDLDPGRTLLGSSACDIAKWCQSGGGHPVRWLAKFVEVIESTSHLK